MIGATGGCDRNHKLAIGGVIDDYPEKLSFGLKSFATEVPPYAHANRNCVATEAAFLFHKAAAVGIS